MGQHQREPRRYRPDDPPQEGDETVGAWPRSELERMDQRFAKAIQRELEAKQDNSKPR